MATEPTVKARDFESRNVYHSSETPGYTSWVSFFPGHNGRWYLTCEEVRRPATPLAKASRQQWYEIGSPVGYDKSQYLLEAVIFESTDNMGTWREISRQAYHHQHAVHQFATARTKEGRFLRFIWACYSLDETVTPSDIFYTSDDEGKTWEKMPPFHHERFSSFAHRLRSLRDGTLVLALPLSTRWGKGWDRPIRAARNLDAINESSMTLYFSYDQGHTWSGPLPIYGGQIVSETDFVELPEGDLLCINNGFYANPGRQRIYRHVASEGTVTWTPGALERSRGKTRAGEANEVPETVALTEDNILVGCMRAGRYSWSDDMGLTWQRLEGIPEIGPEVYQPWIYYLGENRFACAGHYGRDAPISGADRDDQNINLHLFEIEVLRKTRNTTIEVVRDYDESHERWKNEYTITLRCGADPLAGKEVEIWYAERNKPGYDSHGKQTLEERMKMGGKLLKAVTDSQGVAQVALPEFDDPDHIHKDWPGLQEVHFIYQLIARFNHDYADPEFKPAQSCQFSFYAIHRPDPAF